LSGFFVGFTIWVGRRGFRPDQGLKAFSLVAAIRILSIIQN
jgi:hypothetical protein